MLLTDTKRFYYITETENVYEDYYKGKESFEISNYSKDSICYDIKNNLVVGNMKDKTCGVPIKSACICIYVYRPDSSVG